MMSCCGKCEDTMAPIPNATLAKLRAGKTAIAFSVHHLRSVSVPMMARAAGFDWLFIDMEHGALSLQEATQLCIAALPTGITPIVRVCGGAFDEGTRALDNGAQGLVIPHISTLAQAKRVVDAFRFPPQGSRSWGGGLAVYGYGEVDSVTAQAELDNDVLICCMIETEEAVANADAIAALPGIDALLIGSSDLTIDMGISGQFGHAKVQAAYKTVIAACKKHGKHPGMGGIYDQEWTTFYTRMGARFTLGGSDAMFIMQAASARGKFFAGM
jgi:2-keto-3-deoxy-L-rhamnonate aldolase RhmA